MSDVILGGDLTIYYSADNNQKRIEWTGAATGTRTLNQVYSALQNLFDDPSQMDDLIPMKADTPDIYRMQNQWFIDDTTVEHLKTGSLFSSGWKSGTTEHILIIGYAQTTEFNAADIGRTILGTTSTDTGTILDFNTIRKLVWIRPDDPLVAGDEFDNGFESYTIRNDAISQVWQFDFSGTSYVDETVDANSAAANDWAFFPAGAGVSDYAAAGFAQKFSKLRINVGTAGTGTYTVTWQYWNGAWTALAGVTDGTTNLKTAGSNNVTFTVPTDWAKTSINGSAQLYFVRALRDGGTVTVDPLGTQGWIGGVGAGAFATHNRHGVASKAGESAWTGITTIGTIEANTHIYVGMEDPDKISVDKLIIASKDTTDWWGDGHLNVLLKTKEADNVIGQLPNSSPATAVTTVLARQYSKTFSHFIATGLATAGGNTVVPLSTADDLDNPTGYQRMTVVDSSGTGTFVVDEVISKAGTTKKGVVTAVAGTSANPIITYYLIGDPLTNFQAGDTAVTGATSAATLTAPAPADVGPALDTDITATHGAVAVDIDENGTTEPYSIDINNTANKTAARMYERFKFLTRRGETATASTNGQQGQFYLGDELQVEYNAQASGNFSQGRKVYDQTTDAEGVIVADHDDGATGDVILRTVRGTFTNTNVLSDSPDPTYVMNTNSKCYAVDVSVPSIVDESADALSAGVGDVNIFVGTEEVNVDYFAIGAIKPFAKVIFNNTGGTAGTVGVVAWEYWDGTTWADLETVPNFSDGTTDFKAAVGAQNLVFYPPLNWEPRGLSDGTTNSPTLFFIRARVTTAYTVNPVYDTIAVEDNVTATINGIPRTIAVVTTAPFGTFPGASKLFFAPGAAPLPTEMATGESQKFQTIDDNGNTKLPPNKQDMTVTNLVSGDTVTTLRIDSQGGPVTKNQFTSGAGNAQSNTTLVVGAAIGSDNPSTGVVRIVSVSNVEHKYRYASFTASTFTLATGVVGGTSGGGNSSATRLHDTVGTPFAAAEVGDFVRNITEGKVVRITNKVDSNNVDTEAVTGWSGDSYDYNVLMETYSSGRNVYVPIIERIADATSETSTIVYPGSDINVRIDVRKAGTILPFSQDSTFISTGRSIATVRSSDDIFTP